MSTVKKKKQPPAPSVAQELGKLVADLRHNLGMSQEQLAAAIGSSRIWVSYIETGRYLPSEDALLLFAKLLPPELRQPVRAVAGARQAGATDAQFHRAIAAARTAMLGSTTGSFNRK